VDRIDLARFNVVSDAGTEKVDGEVWHCIVVPGQARQYETIANSAPALATSSGMGPLCEATAAAATLEAGEFAHAPMDMDSGGDAVVRAPAGGIPMSGLAAAGGGAGVGGESKTNRTIPKQIALLICVGVVSQSDSKTNTESDIYFGVVLRTQ
jgi:hypothetical protein